MEKRIAIFILNDTPINENKGIPYSEAVERMARAIYETATCCAWYNLVDEDMKEDYRKQARAALNAILE